MCREEVLVGSNIDARPHRSSADARPHRSSVDDTMGIFKHRDDNLRLRTRRYHPRVGRATEPDPHHRLAREHCESCTCRRTIYSNKTTARCSSVVLDRSLLPRAAPLGASSAPRPPSGCEGTPLPLPGADAAPRPRPLRPFGTARVPRGAAHYKEFASALRARQKPLIETARARARRRAGSPTCILHGDMYRFRASHPA